MKKIYPIILLATSWLLAFSAFGQQSYTVHFVWGPEHFPANYGELRQHPDVTAAELVEGRFMRYIQCSSLPGSAEREAMEALGVKFITYVDFGAYLVSLPQNFDFSVLEKIHVRSVVPVPGVWKMARSLREKPYGAWAVHGDQIDVNIQLYPQISIARGAELCRQYGLNVLLEGRENGFLQVRLPEANLDIVAALPFIQYLELKSAPGRPEDTKGRSLHRSNLLDSDHALGKHYNGAGVNVLVRDDGKLGPHIDFQGRLYNHAEGAPDAGSHGDGVGGIICGAGNLDPTKKGMAAGANLFTVDYTDEFQDETLPLHLDENVTITNTSYSNGCNAGYTIIAQTIDEQLFNHPMLMHVFSAGNRNGVSDCGYGAGDQWANITGGHKMGKNAIATANLTADGSLDGTSSRGPAHDGRLKPDIAANGTDQNSCSPFNTYQVFGGTSAAAPGIVGCLAQLTQAYKEMHGGLQPEAALLKATLLNTANDLGNVGPDFKFGWGHVNAYRALRSLEQNHWLTGSTDQAGVSTNTVQIPAGTKQAKIMIYWLEPPAAENAAKTLLNDLDLQVLAPNGEPSLPWLLDPSPDPLLLDQPAGKGRDSLNNVEQVAIDNPVAGTYTVKVTGTAVPFGPQPYVLVWEFLTDDIALTYPAGGEGFVPGETERLYWDAYGNSGNTTLRYSTDNGNSWLPITNISDPAKRFFDWTVPNAVSSEVRVLAIRGSKRDTTDQPLTIARIPQNVVIRKVCPDSITVDWTTPVNDTLSYGVYLLGQKYMELRGISDTSFLQLPIQNAGLEQWVAVRTNYSNGLGGRRSLAVNWAGGLKSCPQADDLDVRELIEPGNAAIVACGPINQNVTVSLTNAGMNPVVGAILYYQVNNDPPVSAAVDTIPTGAVKIFTFPSPINITTNGQIRLKVWSDYAPDHVFFNDTLQVIIPVTVAAATGYFVENFDSPNFPPLGWTVVNPDNGITWVPTAAQVTGSDDLPTTALYLNCFNYQDRGAEDYIYLIPADLGSVDNPALTFDLAHAGYNTSTSEALAVEVFQNCNLNSQPVTVWQKADPELATTVNSTSPFTPTSGDEWRTEVISLSQFAGQSVIIRIVSNNDYGNNMYLDNIG
ncbi:MAG: S8 family serine peptidase, partial [Saprospiraceae bacterium]